MRRTVTTPADHRVVIEQVGDGVPLVLVHGSSGGLDSWRPVVSALGDGFATLTYARAAYRPSTRGPQGRPTSPMTFATEVDDLLAVVEAAGTGPAHLVGGSYGAIVALHAAIDPRADWRSVTLFEPPLYATGPALGPVLDRYRAEVGNGRLTRAARIFAAEVARVPADLLGPEPDPSRATTTPDPDALAAAQGCLADLEAMVADEPGPGRSAAIPAPVLLLRGELTWDPMPATMTALHAALPASAQEVVLPGQSHVATHSAPDLVAAALRTFVTQVDGAR